MPTVITGIARTPIGRFGGPSVRWLRSSWVGLPSPPRSSDPGVDPLSSTRSSLVTYSRPVPARSPAAGGGSRRYRHGRPRHHQQVCLSGMTAIAMADKDIRLGEAKFVVAGGMESMTNAPYVVPDARWGARIGNTAMVDTMNHDGLWCAFDQCTMGESSDRKNKVLGIGREEQDAWSVESHRRAAAATESGHFSGEIARYRLRNVRVIRSSSPPMRESAPIRQPPRSPRSVPPSSRMARLRRVTRPRSPMGPLPSCSPTPTLPMPPVSPCWRPFADTARLGSDATLHDRPAEALRIALKRVGMKPGNLDLVEVNEAFAAVALWSARSLDIDANRINVHGGAIALGHPLGATGARIVVTLINVARQRGRSRCSGPVRGWRSGRRHHSRSCWLTQKDSSQAS